MFHTKWENPEDSIGECLCEIRVKSRPRFFWAATGPALELWTTEIQGKVQEWLNASGKIFPEPVGRSMYMFGKRKEKAQPIILFCGEKDSRKEAMEIVNDGLREEYPGVITGERSLPPELGSDFQELPTQ
ncbi:hypothetical protein AOQ84DRAFT_425946 [Glonium stellatum]|uniref:Uncharacterized protein n=1 Tax=Glonium stellatum TaxID=574774 RepID=A0A8E2F6H2_9PEZI|nr:hypothetical protein AOQ84DRAFT_425946 [Glonium stellatum]